MTTNEQATACDELVATIVKAVPSVVMTTCWPCCIRKNHTKHKPELYPITLEDVLRAAKQSLENDSGDRVGKLIVGEGFDMTYGGLFAAICCRWHFGHDLAWHRDNAPETITFLHSLLCK